MRYKIFGQEDEIEEVVNLRFINNKIGVTVAVVDEHGCTIKNLLTFTVDGCVRMHSAISKRLGLNLDHCERIRVV